MVSHKPNINALGISQTRHGEMENTLHMASSNNILAGIPEYVLTESSQSFTNIQPHNTRSDAAET